MTVTATATVLKPQSAPVAATATPPARLLPPLDDEMCWEAVSQRRSTSDGLFFVAVTSTKIYCRPSCSSRTPMRKNMRFFRTADECEAAGFRACKRCQPRDPARSDVTLVKRIARRIEETGSSPRLIDLSAEFGVSQFHLQRTFKRVTGLTPRQYADAHRTERLKTTLRNGSGNGVAAALYEAGYGSSSRAYESAPGQLGMTPAAYGRGGAGMSIAFTITTCTFGRMLVAATERGISAVSFGQGEKPMIDALHAEYPAAEIARDDTSMRRWVEGVLRTVDAGEQPQLPLDIRATAFRRKVWEALRAIPRGETRTYAQIAKSIGSPKAARAVGNACHDNPVAVIIPCHRVVAANGLGGYAFGLDTKKKLLAREGAQEASAQKASAQKAPAQKASAR